MVVTVVACFVALATNSTTCGVHFARLDVRDFDIAFLLLKGEV
jgi:hypothetical protein